MGLEDVLKKTADELLKIKHTQGEEAYNKAVQNIAERFLGSKEGEELLRRAFPDFDFAAMRGEQSSKTDSPPMPEFGQNAQERQMLRMLAEQIPNMKTQAQLTVFMAAFDALRLILDGYFGGNLEQATQARNALDQALDMGRQTFEISSKVSEVSDATKSDTAKSFEQLQPTAVHEYDFVKAYIVKINNMTSHSELSEWYAENRTALDKILDPKLRNSVFDTIRAKQRTLGVS